jgi:hypothetical protein
VSVGARREGIAVASGETKGFAMVETGILERLGLKEKPREAVSPSAADADFLSDEDLRDAAVGFALRRVAFSEALEHIDTAYAVKAESIAAQYKPDLELTVTVLNRVRDGIEHEEILLTENATKSEGLRQDRVSLSERIKELRFNVYIKIQEIRRTRLEKEREMFRTEGDRLKSEAAAKYDEAISDLDKQIGIARKLHELEKEKWATHKGEYDRRVLELTKEKERVEEELNAARNNINALKRFGITRHTAGFLIWAGYASLAGVGGVIASLLNGQPMGRTSYVSLIFQYLTNIINALQTIRTPSDFLYLVLWPCIVVLIILAVTGGLVLLADFLLQKFDKKWKVNWRGKPGGGKKSRRSGKDNSKEQLPDLTPPINRLSIPLPEVDRKSYVKLLALLPYLFLAFVIVLLSVSGADKSNSSTNPLTPTGALSMTYIGVVFVLLTVSVTMLYATKVIEPRWRKLVKVVEDQRPSDGPGDDSPDAEKPAPLVGFRMYLRAHWEFVVLICAMVLALLAIIFLPASDYRSHVIWSAVAIFMCFSSLAFAYGIIQRGLFRNEEYLDGRRALYRVLIEKYSTEPTVMDVFDIAGVFDAVNSDELKNIVDNYRRSRKDFDELRLLYELKRQFADNYVDDADILKYFTHLKNWADPLGFLAKLTFKKPDPTEPGLLDYEYAPEETSAVNESREELLRLRSRVDETATELDRAERARSEIKSRLKELESELRAQEKRRVELEQSLQQDEARLKVKKEADYLTFKSAYSLGIKVADFTDF